jgi:hypothetical protein
MAQEEGLESPRKDVVKIPSPRAVYRRGILDGSMACLMAVLIFTDILGRDGLCDWIRANWTDSDTTMPIQIVVSVTLGMAMVGFWRRLPSRKR